MFVKEKVSPSHITCETLLLKWTLYPHHTGQCKGLNPGRLRSKYLVRLLNSECLFPHLSRGDNKICLAGMLQEKNLAHWLAMACPQLTVTEKYQWLLLPIFVFFFSPKENLALLIDVVWSIMKEKFVLAICIYIL